ncbi:MAG: energy transducer TonB [Hellea sp.]|nr:energy transducer TonB [Hellea sp.]
MTLLTRLTFSALGASVITIGLGLSMVELIRVEFEAEAKQPELVLDIGTVLEPIEPDIGPREPPKPLDDVVPPPAPPEPDYAAKEKVTEPVAHVGKNKPDLTLPPPDRSILDIFESDVDAVPTIRTAGIMPDRAERSGHCKMVFDVSPDGGTANIRAQYCSDRIFERASVNATAKFKYRPKRVDGQYVTMTGVETTIRYVLKDDRGRIIPEI